uniref:28 kDa Metastriate family member n=1 Tax=Rhipicephalus zambeziensis TaxID=60191 RepID=A0A224Y0V8_9ACAR
MNPVNLLVLTLYLATSIVSISTQKHEKGPWLRVGDGVTVHANVVFDSTVKNDKTKRQPTAKNFRRLFQGVQRYFHTEKVFVKFVVKSAEKKDALAVKGKWESVNASATLEKVIKYAEEQQPSNDTITYFFTETPLLERSKGSDLAGSELYFKATFNTFCNKTPSAAVVRYYSLESSEGTVAATAWTFGEKKHKNFNLRDYWRMNAKFSHCPRNTR